MRVAVAASLLKSISPESTGGTEAFAHILTEGLVAKNLDVTLFATSDSQTKATLSSVASSLQTTGIYEGNIETRIPYQLLQIRDILSKSEKFDIIHNNYFHFFLLTTFSSFTQTPVITTMHNHYWQYPNLKHILSTTLQRDKDVVVFASKAAQKPADGLFPSEVIYHGIDIAPFPFSEKADDYVCFFSRVVPTKGIKDAIDAARNGNFKLKIAGGQAVSPEDKAFVAEHVTPYFSDSIQSIGSPNEAERLKLYQNAKALLFPTHIDEQFGLVAAEAMACGTPVIAYNRGAVAEVVKDGVTGFIIDPEDGLGTTKGSWVIKKRGVEGLIEAYKRIEEIDRAACRAHVEKHFTSERMIVEYIALYKRVLNKA
jgi:glycosyltransferase involved in cell wall biosynthesis